MLFDETRRSGAVSWPGGRPRDQVTIPDLAVPLLASAGLTARVGHNVYEIVNNRGDALQLDFGCIPADWEAAITQLKGHV